MKLILLIFIVIQVDKPKVERVFSDDFLARLAQLRQLTEEIRVSDLAERGQLLIDRAQLLIELDDLLAARTDLEQALLLGLAHDKAQRARLMLAKLYKKFGQLHKAAEMYEAALDLGENLTALQALAYLRLDFGQYDEALALAKRLQDATPNDPEVRLLLAKILSEKGKRSQALEILEPSLPETSILLAEEAIKDRLYSKARNLLQAVDSPKARQMLKTLDEAEALEAEWRQIKAGQQYYSTDFSVRCARFNDKWYKRSTRRQFTTAAVRIVKFTSAVKINLKSKTSSALYHYLVDNSRQLTVQVEGPTILKLSIRPVHSEAKPKAISLKISVAQQNRQVEEFTITDNLPSQEVAFTDFQGIVPGVAETLELEVPFGIHKYEITSIGGAALVLPSAMVVTDYDILIGDDAWWARAYLDFERLGIWNTVDAIEARYRVLGDKVEALEALESVSELGYPGYLLLAELRKHLGLTYAKALEKAAELAPSYENKYHLTIAAIKSFVQEGDKESAVRLCKSWLSTNDVVIRTLLVEILLSQNDAVEALLRSPNEKLAAKALSRLAWERRLDPIRSAGTEQVILTSFESSNKFRRVRESLLANVFPAGQIISENQSAQLTTHLTHPARLKLSIYVQGLNTGSDAAQLEVLVDSTPKASLQIPNGEFRQIQIDLEAGKHELKVRLEESQHGTWYAQVHIEREDTGTVIKPSLKLEHFVATPEEAVAVNTDRRVMRLRVRALIRKGAPAARKVSLKITKQAGGLILDGLETSADLLQGNNNTAYIPQDPHATLGNTTDILVLLPELNETEFYQIEVRPDAGQLLVLAYEARNGFWEEEEAQQISGLNIDQLTDYSRPSQVKPSSMPSLRYYLLDSATNSRGLLSFYFTADSERASLLDADGVRTTSGQNFIEQGLVYRKALSPRSVYLRAILGERTLSSGSAVFRSEAELIKRLPTLDLSARLRLFAQQQAASFRTDISLTHRIQLPKKHLTIRSSLAYFNVLQTLKSISAEERAKISRQVFIPFLTNHPQGLTFRTTLTYTPFLDTMFSGQFTATTNRSLNPLDIDRIRYRLRMVHVLMEGRLSIDTAFGQIYRFVDRHRRRPNRTEDITTSVDYSWWTASGRRFALEGGLRWVTGFDLPVFTFGLSIDINRSRGFDDYLPNEINFEQQRLRTYHHRAVKKEW
ncbi:MAG: tetratricopeptide repeat protein [Acidobacteriota bacterium]|nr:tetratricopeptide repeat protein [Blastocatellia bacterium]MDW8411210.1 tetratricopeptide repeat protein [Acidobacteriota bacterium]